MILVESHPPRRKKIKLIISRTRRRHQIIKIWTTTMNDRPSRGHAHQTRPRSTTNESDARMRDSSVVSLSLSFALKKSQDDEENIDAKKIDIHGDISKYLSNSKRSHRKGEFPRKLSPDIIISLVLIILVLKVAQKNVPSSAPPESSRL